MHFDAFAHRAKRPWVVERDAQRSGTPTCLAHFVPVATHDQPARAGVLGWNRESRGFARGGDAARRDKAALEPPQPRAQCSSFSISSA
jgi:hypothetical protein